MRGSHFRIIILCQLNILALGNTGANALQPRSLPTKPAAVAEPEVYSELSVKFQDVLKVRAVNGNLISNVGADITALQQVQQQFALTFEQSIQLPQETLDFVETRAAQTSGIAQPDFASFVVVTGPAQSLEDAANAFLALDEVEWIEFTLPGAPAQACYDIPPTTPDYFAQGLQNYHGPNPGLNMACAWTFCGRGQGIRFADIEAAYRPLHEDRCTVNGPTLSCVHDVGEDHGTAVLGVIAALDNGYGCTGLAPDSIPYFFSLLNQFNCAQTSGTTAFTNAIANLRAGDVLVVEWAVAGGGAAAGISFETTNAIWSLTKSATDSGIVVVAAAGNGNVDLDDSNHPNLTLRQILNSWRSWGDSGAIIVGAGTTDTDHNRLNFSSYGSRVDVQGWGENVFTTGYGPIDLAPGDPDRKQTYAPYFNGTSSATAVVSGAAVGLQSIRLQHGLPLYNSVQMRNLLKNTGWPQGSATSATPIGPFPNVAKAILQMGIGAIDSNGNGVPNECEPPAYGQGACCLDSLGSCARLSPCQCDDQGIYFHGVGSKCEWVNCFIEEQRPQGP